MRCPSQSMEMCAQAEALAGAFKRPGIPREGKGTPSRRVSSLPAFVYRLSLHTGLSVLLKTPSVGSPPRLQSSYTLLVSPVLARARPIRLSSTLCLSTPLQPLCPHSVLTRHDQISDQIFHPSLLNTFSSLAGPDLLPRYRNPRGVQREEQRDRREERVDGSGEDEDVGGEGGEGEGWEVRGHRKAS